MSSFGLASGGAAEPRGEESNGVNTSHPNAAGSYSHRSLSFANRPLRGRRRTLAFESAYIRVIRG